MTIRDQDSQVLYSSGVSRLMDYQKELFMREITKMITLPAGDEMMAFRLTKPDAFSGGRLLKLLSAAQGKAEGSLTLWDGKGRLELTVPRSHRGQVDRFRTASEGGRPLLH